MACNKCIHNGICLISYNEVTDEFENVENCEHFKDKDKVIISPCKVGDKVYDISEFFDGTNCPEIYEYDVDRIEITEEKGQQVLYIADLKYPSNEWGKQLFFAREAAEQELKGGAE